MAGTEQRLALVSSSPNPTYHRDYTCVCSLALGLWALRRSTTCLCFKVKGRKCLADDTLSCLVLLLLHCVHPGDRRRGQRNGAAEYRQVPVRCHPQAQEEGREGRG